MSRTQKFSPTKSAQRGRRSFVTSADVGDAVKRTYKIFSYYKVLNAVQEIFTLKRPMSISRLYVYMYVCMKRILFQ